MRSWMIIAAALALWVGTAAGAQAQVKAVASFSILADMVRNVGGERVAVTSLVGANGDAHVYEPKPGDVAELAGADILFVNGLGFEGWMDRLQQSSGYDGPVVVASAGIAARTMDEDGATITDPHAWQDLSNGLLYVRNIADGLCKADPEGCPAYRADAQAYSAQIVALDTKVKGELAAVPPERRQVITSHDAFGYFGVAYGVSFLAPEGISTDSEPSAAAVARLIDQIRTTGTSALFIENMSDPRLLEQIARETGATIGGALYSDALSEPGQGADTYLSMFRHNLSLLVPAMLGQN